MKKSDAFFTGSAISFIFAMISFLEVFFHPINYGKFSMFFIQGILLFILGLAQFRREEK